MAFSVSDRFLRAVTAPYKFAKLVEIRRNGVTVLTDVAVKEGSIQVDRTSDVRRTCSLKVVGITPDLVPSARNRSPFDPYGNEIVIWTGIEYPDGSKELLPQGVFGITSCELVDTVEGIALQITGSDRANRIGKAKLLKPWNTLLGTSALDAIEALAEDRYPGIQVVDLTSSEATFSMHVLEEQADPWADGIEVFADAVGAEAFMDRYGRLVIQDVPDPANQPVAWRFVEGKNCVVTSLTRKYDDSTPNAVVITNETPDAALIRAVVVDTDPESPTYYGPDEDNPVPGGYGPRPIWESNPLITSTSQATIVAEAKARLLFGGTEQVLVSIVPNGAIDEGDLIYVERERSGFRDVMVVQSFPVPVTYKGTMDLVCITRRTVA